MYPATGGAAHRPNNNPGNDATYFKDGVQAPVTMTMGIVCDTPVTDVGAPVTGDRVPKSGARIPESAEEALNSGAWKPGSGVCQMIAVGVPVTGDMPLWPSTMDPVTDVRIWGIGAWSLGFCARNSLCGESVIQSTAPEVVGMAW